ncbi:MAG TPA: CoA protein activase [candidate division Zixibacteria bacterium]|nr:CoA protein activase [candidate division Zixibacteria bacterium]
MPFTYPHFGSLKYVFQSLLNELGRPDQIVPNKPSKKTAQLGSMHSPEFVCTPFKITLGTFIESLERGATELGSGGGNGYCRFRSYWGVQKLILEDLGFDFKFITIDYENPMQILRAFKGVSNNCTTLQTIRAFRIAWTKNRLTDLIDKLVYRYRAIELIPGTTDKVANKLFQQVVEIKGVKNIRRLQRKIPEIFEESIEIQKDINPIKVVINGEIYVVLEPSLNLDIHRRLNKLGVIVETPTTIRKFIDIGMRINPFIKMHHKVAMKTAKRYVPYHYGGEIQENIGDTMIFSKKGYDGIIHLYPFTCMPEIITRSILPQVSREHDIAVLSLVVDEQTGEAGFQTRLEAFVDLLIRKRAEKNKKS